MTSIMFAILLLCYWNKLFGNAEILYGPTMGEIVMHIIASTVKDIPDGSSLRLWDAKVSHRALYVALS